MNINTKFTDKTKRCFLFDLFSLAPTHLLYQLPDVLNVHKKNSLLWAKTFKDVFFILLNLKDIPFIVCMFVLRNILVSHHSLCVGNQHETISDTFMLVFNYVSIHSGFFALTKVTQIEKLEIWHLNSKNTSMNNRDKNGKVTWFEMYLQYAIATSMIMLHIDVWLTLVHQNHFRLNKSSLTTIKVLQCLE